MGKWQSVDLGPIQVKRVQKLLNEVNFEHHHIVRLTRTFDGANFHEDRNAYYEISGGSRRPDLLEKENALFEKYKGMICKVDLPAIEADLSEILTWAKTTPPTKDERESEEVLRERHEAYQKRREDERKRQEEFNAKATEIPMGKRGVVLEVCFDNSDIMTDYFDRHHTLEKFLLAVVPDGREDERGLRDVINRIPQLKEIPFEWHTEKYSMGHGNYLESKACPETRKHPHQDHQVNCHYELRYQPSRHSPTRVIPHPQWYQGELNGESPSSSGNGKAQVFSMTIRQNMAMGGIEIIFPEKPAREVIDTLKSYGFRWSQRQGLWWKRYTPSLWNSIKNCFPLADVEGEQEASTAAA